MKLITRITLPLALTALAITGCSGQGTPTETASPTQSASASPTPSASASPATPKTPTPSSKATRTPSASAEPTTPTAHAAPTDDGMTTSLNEFLATGGVCFADYFPAGPLTTSATAEVQDYCASQAPAAQVPPEDERAECEALDPATASSGAIQYCYMEYGADPAPAAPLRDQDPYAGLSDDELAELPVTGMP